MTKSDSSTLIELTNAGVKRWKMAGRGITFSLHAGEIVTPDRSEWRGENASAKMALGLLDLDEGTALQNLSCVSAMSHKSFH